MTTILAVLGCGLALMGCRLKSDPAATPTAAAPVVAPVATPALDVSGRWECMWNLRDGNGVELWTLMQDGQGIRVTLSGRDPGGRYTGSMTGQIKDRDVRLDYRYHDGTHGTMTLKASANGKVLDGESRRANPKAVPQHYACSRS
jgi:hypothetical protein